MGTKYTVKYFIRMFEKTKEKAFPVNVEEFYSYVSPRAGEYSAAILELCWYLSDSTFKSYFSKRKKDGLTPKQRMLVALRERKRTNHKE